MLGEVKAAALPPPMGADGAREDGEGGCEKLLCRACAVRVLLAIACHVCMAEELRAECGCGCVGMGCTGWRRSSACRRGV